MFIVRRSEVRSIDLWSVCISTSITAAVNVHLVVLNTRSVTEGGCRRMNNGKPITGQYANVSEFSYIITDCYFFNSKSFRVKGRFSNFNVTFLVDKSLSVWFLADLVECGCGSSGIFPLFSRPAGAHLENRLRSVPFSGPSLQCFTGNSRKWGKWVHTNMNEGTKSLGVWLATRSTVIIWPF